MVTDALLWWLGVLCALFITGCLIGAAWLWWEATHHVDEWGEP